MLIVSEAALKRYNLTPIGKFLGFSVAGVPPEIMGIGPIEAIPAAMKAAGYISEYDERVGRKIAFVLTGGDVPAGTKLSEQDLLDLERAQGRFLAVYPRSRGILDPMIYSKGRLVTLAGTFVCPRLLAPQATTVPSSCRAREWSRPAAMATT